MPGKCGSMMLAALGSHSLLLTSVFYFLRPIYRVLCICDNQHVGVAVGMQTWVSMRL